MAAQLSTKIYNSLKGRPVQVMIDLVVFPH